MTDTTARAERQSVLHDVAEFHRAFEHPIHTTPQHFVPTDLVNLRIDLLREEFQEYLKAARDEDVVEIADALADMQYIINGTALVYGIDLNAVHAEVHRSNMSKLGPNGQVVRRADGKVLKPATYEPPMIVVVLEEQDGTHLQPEERAIEVRRHDYDTNSFSAASPYCAAMVERGGGGDQCGLLRDDPAHLPLTAVVQTLDGVQHIGVLPVDAATARNSDERPKRNTLDDRLRALETILAFPNGRIDDLNRESAQQVIIEARNALKKQVAAW